MSVLHAGLLAAGLAAVAIPIIIHLLFRRRRRPIAWGAMRFLLEAYQRMRRRLRLEQWLLLASRCLLVALVAAALARPILGSTAMRSARTSSTVYLLVDTSLPSAATGPSDLTALERHQATARQLLAQLDPASGDRAGLIALGAPAEALVVPPSADLAAVADLIDRLAPTHGVMDLAGGLTLVDAALRHHVQAHPGRVYAVVLSDFLAGSADLESSLPNLAEHANLTVLAAEPARVGIDNVAVTSVEPLRPVLLADPHRAGPSLQSDPVRVRLRRSGPGVGEAALTAMRLRMVDRGAELASAESSLRWAPGQEDATVTLTFAGGQELPVTGADQREPVRMLVAETPADALEADNTFRRPVQVRSSLVVGVVAPRQFGLRPEVDRLSPAQWVELALRPAPDDRASPIEVRSVEPATIDPAVLAALDAVVVTRPDLVATAAWSRLAQFARNGGLVMVAPPPQPAAQLWVDELLAAFGLDWQVEREPVIAEPPLSLSTDVPVLPVGADLLALIRGEQEQLVGPVNIWRYLALEAPDATVLLELANGRPLLVASSLDAGERDATGAGDSADTDTPAARGGLLVFCTVAFSFEWTDVQARPLMVPLLHELVRQGVGAARGSSTSHAGEPVWAGTGIVELVAVTEQAEPLVARVLPSGFADAPFRRAGVWAAVDAAGAPGGLIAVNPDPAATRCDAQSAAAVRQWLARAVGGRDIRWLQRDIDAGDVPRLTAAAWGEDAPWSVSRWLLLSAVAVAVVELALARWFSHAGRDATGPVGPRPLVPGSATGRHHDQAGHVAPGARR